MVNMSCCMMHNSSIPVLFMSNLDGYMSRIPPELFDGRHMQIAMMRDLPANYIWLVVWNTFYFSIYWECHHPN